ncbi:hypothetical protein BDR05DRAFT_950108 [Suillus weaverae]|nr:hypothetical protein BDR05DRAFT_950108 [Suillus weaverae]
MSNVDDTVTLLEDMANTSRVSIHYHDADYRISTSIASTERVILMFHSQVAEVGTEGRQNNFSAWLFDRKGREQGGGHKVADAGTLGEERRASERDRALWVVFGGVVGVFAGPGHGRDCGLIQETANHSLITATETVQDVLSTILETVVSIFFDGRNACVGLAFRRL